MRNPLLGQERRAPPPRAMAIWLALPLKILAVLLCVFIVVQLAPGGTLARLLSMLPGIDERPFPWSDPID